MLERGRIPSVKCRWITVIYDIYCQITSRFCYTLTGHWFKPWFQPFSIDAYATVSKGEGREGGEGNVYFSRFYRSVFPMFMDENEKMELKAVGYISWAEVRLKYPRVSCCVYYRRIIFNYLLFHFIYIYIFFFRLILSSSKFQRHVYNLVRFIRYTWKRASIEIKKLT